MRGVLWAVLEVAWGIVDVKRVASLTLLGPILEAIAAVAISTEQRIGLYDRLKEPVNFAVVVGVSSSSTRDGVGSGVMRFFGSLNWRAEWNCEDLIGAE